MLRQALARCVGSIALRNVQSYAACTAAGVVERSVGSIAQSATASSAAVTSTWRLHPNTASAYLLVGERRSAVAQVHGELQSWRYFSAAAAVRAARVAKPAAARSTTTKPKPAAAAKGSGGSKTKAAKPTKSKARGVSGKAKQASSAPAKRIATTRPRKRASTGRTASARAKEAEKKERAKQRAKERAARARAKEREKKEKAKQAAKVKAARERAKAKEAREKQKQREAKEKAREKAREKEAARIKRPLSAYNLFVKEHANVFKSTDPNQSRRSAGEFKAKALELSRRYKELPPEERRKYEEMAAKLKVETQKLREERAQEQRSKKALTPYMLFYKDTFPKLKEENPGSKLPELGKLLGDMWRSMAAADKQKYVDASDADARMKGLKSSLSGAAPAGSESNKPAAGPGDKAPAGSESSKPAAGPGDKAAAGPEGSKL